ncbi:MAG: cobaltochelatase subunit CobN, partial [Desulfobacterales bacterium]|nr:cobaltochelatase subunit CobN [Desulfobacterales bacterium]
MKPFVKFSLARFALVLGFIVMCTPAKTCFAADKAPDIAFMVLDHNSYIARLALDSPDLPGKLKSGIAVISPADLEQAPERFKQVLSKAKVILVDVMGRELESFVSKSIDPASKPVYALRGSLDDASLEAAGFIFDDGVSGYYRHISLGNIKNMLRLIIHRHLDKTISYGPVKKRPQLGIYHPDAGKHTTEGSGVFTNIGDYLSWQEKRPGFDPQKPAAGFLFFSSFLTRGQQAPVDDTIRRLEAEGFNVFPCFGREKDIIKNFLLNPSGRSRVDMILAFSFKFYSGLTPELARLLEQLDVPVFSAVSIYRDTLAQWRDSPVGIDAQSVAWSLAVPEISGLIEPTVLAAKEKHLLQGSGKPYYLSRLADENMDRLIPRLKNWLVLRKKPTEDKKVAIMFYNHHQGKQNIGASYLNVFRSIEQIVSALSKKGYRTGPVLTEEEIKSMILASARNVGSWAPGELNRMLDKGQVIRLPLDTYKLWFETLPQDFKEKVISQWGPPGRSFVMVKDKSFVIPAVKAGNLTILPEPARGWGDDPMKLYHDTTLYPHHQYLAVYLWLQKDFKADAMIHLGTHSTYEWTPGKQAGLSPSCSPEVLITDIPNIYPYIVDNIGEGIQAKRRGRGVMVSHLTPVLKQADVHGEYSRMAELVSEIEQAEARGSLTVEEKVKALFSLAESTGIFSDLKDSVASDHDRYHAPDEEASHNHNTAGQETEADLADASGPLEGGQREKDSRKMDRATAEKIHLLGHYLEDIKADLVPFGMHTFGKSPDPDAVKELTGAVLEANPSVSEERLAENTAACGPNEIHSLIKGLEGRYVHPGQGNDPVRNPGALPTGRNFYGFNPGKLPTPAAWALGKKAARQIIDNHIIEHGGFPQKVAVIVWATETLRNEGVNESTILNLVGVKPKWSKTGRVLGLEVIKGKELGRPRIDVMVNASGLYRDLFPDKMLFMDRAIRLAERQNDVENLIARHSARVKTRLIRGGM